ncbi:DinB family protein [Candidatus Hydrogenedentota bacterium]
MNQNDINRLADFSERIRTSTIKRLTLVPEGMANKSFPSGAMSPADIAAHLIQIDEVLLKLPQTKFKKKDLGQKGQRVVQDQSEYASLISELECLKTKRKSFILALDDDALGMSIRFEALAGNGEMDLCSMIYRLLDHEIHHRGALSVFLRAIEEGF